MEDIRWKISELGDRHTHAQNFGYHISETIIMKFGYLKLLIVYFFARTRYSNNDRPRHRQRRDTGETELTLVFVYHVLREPDRLENAAHRPLHLFLLAILVVHPLDRARPRVHEAIGATDEHLGVVKARAPEAGGWRHPMAWALSVGVLSCQEPPGAPLGGAGAELGRCHDGCFPMLRAPACPRQAQP